MVVLREESGSEKSVAFMAVHPVVAQKIYTQLVPAGEVLIRKETSRNKQLPVYCFSGIRDRADLSSLDWSPSIGSRTAC